MSCWRLILLNLWYHRRIHVAVAAGVAVATAVITGALLMGDSVRGSLQDLVRQRLGRIDSFLVAQYPFRATLAEELSQQLQLTGEPDGSLNASQHATEPDRQVVPLLLTGGTLSYRQANQSRRATGLSIVGCPDAFWQLGSGGPAKPLPKNGLAISGQIATDMGVRVGDEVVLRLPRVAQVSADSPLGEKTDTIASGRLTVTAVLPATGLARFGLRPSQQLPLNCFLRLSTLQNLLEVPDRVNTLAVASQAAEPPPDPQEKLAAALQPQLADYGLRVEQLSLPGHGECLQISSDRLVLPPPVVAAIEKVVGKSAMQSAITYLANTISVGHFKIPYSTVCGIDSTVTLGPLFEQGPMSEKGPVNEKGAKGERGPLEKVPTEKSTVVADHSMDPSEVTGQPMILGPNEIVLNDWAARELHAAVGDEVTINYYEPETTHGQPRVHQPPLQFRLRAIVPLRNAAGQPTRVADPRLAPELPGVTDQASIQDWDLPFSLVEKIRPQDETYWDEYGATPKAFLSHAVARKAWQTRWGTSSLVRLPATVDQAQFENQLLAALNPADLGMTWLPARQQGQRAANGTTPFAGLFLGFSFFLMAAAVMLIALLFQLGVEQRSGEIGTLLAVGFTAKRVRNIAQAEAMLVAFIGALGGMGAGIGYARIMIHGMTTWWVAATVTPFLQLHVTWTSLVVGLLVGVAIAMLTMRGTLKRLVRCPVVRLLAGETSAPELLAGDDLTGNDLAGEPHAENTLGRRKRPRKLAMANVWVGPVAIGLAGLLVIGAIGWEGETQAGAFFGSGALVLLGLLWGLRQKLGCPLVTRGFSFNRLALRNACRNPNRTLLTTGLAAVAIFLIVALGAFRLTPRQRGTGGFRWLATADLPLHYDLGSPAGRLELGFTRADEKRLKDLPIHAFRLQPGEDASCLNLYQTTQPRVLGVPKSLANHNQFAWAGHAPLPDQITDPWQLLDSKLGSDPTGRTIVPMILDRETAYYSLHLYRIGDRLTIHDQNNRAVTMQIVGLLAGSLLQGDLLIGTANFQALFPARSGTQFFLLGQNSSESGKRKADETSAEIFSLLESRLEDYGFDVTQSEQRLARFMAVQNTYLSTFQSLGLLGMLLGTLGLASAQLRGVLERRGELALLGCVGFSNRRLARLVLTETMLLLVGGLAIGCAAALVAIVPQWVLQQAQAPWRTLLEMVPLILIAGIAAASLAVRNVLRSPRLSALRGD